MKSILFKNIGKRLFLLAFAFECCISCNKLVDISLPTNSLTSEDVFSNDNTVESAVNGLYTQWAISGMVNILSSLSADDISYSGISSNYQEFYENSISEANPNVSTLWNFQKIYAANVIIERLSTNTQISKSVRDIAIGTAKFTRAFNYFYLINMFGDVPLILSSDYRKTSTEPRAPIADVYKQIINDLKDAIILLPSDASDKAKITSWVAKALLARVYLYQGDWSNAYLYSNEIIESGLFHLENDVDNVFLSNSAEAIWHLAPLDGVGYVQEAVLFIPNSNSIPAYPISKGLYGSFEPGDERLAKWIEQINVNNQSYFYPFKYKIKTGTVATEYYSIFRLAEQYLIRSEAEAAQNRLQDALVDIDSLRVRANLPLYSKDGVERTLNDVLLLIEKERRHELFCEWGDRWFNMKRTGRADAVFGSEKPEWKTTAKLFPIYFNELIYNKKLSQNPGYNH